jgi:hypothetical protein
MVTSPGRAANGKSLPSEAKISIAAEKIGVFL